jgi:general secretion pathway protein G
LPWGFTLLELMIVVAIIAVLAMVASAQYSAYIDRVKVDQAKADIYGLALAVQRYYTQTFKYPPDLAAVGSGSKLDPWGQPYHYTDLSGNGSKGKARKDHKLNPLNSDYDLFSAGKDGVFQTQIDQKSSQDDVIRARDGGFVDLAERF